MDDALFAKLPLRTQVAYAVGLASRVMGRDKVVNYVRQLAPIIADRVGHGDVADPATNYWGGTWQVYRAE